MVVRYSKTFRGGLVHDDGNEISVICYSRLEIGSVYLSRCVLFGDIFSMITRLIPFYYDHLIYPPSLDTNELT